MLSSTPWPSYLIFPLVRLCSDTASFRHPSPMADGRQLRVSASHCRERTHHQLCAPLQLQGLGCLLLQVQQLLLPQKVLLREELQLLCMVQGAAARWVQGRPERRHCGSLHQLSCGGRHKGESHPRPQLLRLLLASPAWNTIPPCVYT